MIYPQTLAPGAHILDSGECRFAVWAPLAKSVDLVLYGADTRRLPMQANERGYYHLTTTEAQAGSRYKFRLNAEREFPDPASRFQPDGVHAASQVVDEREIRVQGQWFNLPLHDYIFYELHVGTFTPDGTFEAIISQLDRLKELGITAVELMPIAQFPGTRNWGYDGVYPYAAQNSYGGPWGLKALVEACHQRGLAVVLDVVYNHLGPEGSYLGQYAPYFTDRYRTGWGDSLNFDGEYSDEVRRYFIENALYWLDVFQVDALRLDATHALLDFSAVPLLQELTTAVHDWADRHNRRVYLIAENDRSDARVVQPVEAGGYGLDAQWLDDLHHCLHVLLTGERRGYYADYVGFHQLVKALGEGFVFSGDYSPFRKRRHGTSSAALPTHRFIVSTQNHDQVGNRLMGERLTRLTDFNGAKLAAGIVLLSPYLPMLFMGEEYGDPAPFLYFVSHSDPGLVEAIRRGRAEEFKSFNWNTDPPDAFAEETFNCCIINPELRYQGQHRVLYDYYQTLLRLRRSLPALTTANRADIRVTGYEREQVIVLHRRAGHSETLLIFNIHAEQTAELLPALPAGRWQKRLDTTEPRWQMDGNSQPAAYPDELDTAARTPITLPPKTLALYEKRQD